MPELVWTNERVGLLKKLVAGGLPYSQIAATLGNGITRNAAIGKAKRLGLADRPKGRAVRAQSKAGTATRRLIKPRTPKPVPVVIAEPVAATPAEPAGNPWARRRNFDVPRIALVDLTEHTCKWPVGDPLEPGFGFCGVQKTPDDGPYCAIHKQRAAFRD